MAHEELIHTEEREGFTIRFYACEEYDSPRGQLMNEDGSDDEETIREIELGIMAWFCAKVTASKEGVELASDYLGCCVYQSAMDFVDEPGAEFYYTDMVNNVLCKAKETIAKLAA
jgi:hypothetical protein